MGRRKLRILILSIAVALLAGLLSLALKRQEPSYQGMTVSQYLDSYATNYPRVLDPDSLRPIYRMGPETIPYLRLALRKRNSVKEKMLTWLRPRLPGGLANRLPAQKQLIYWDGLEGAACHALAFFGPAAREAMPDLLDCLRQSRSINMALYAVMEIGPLPEHEPAFLALLIGTNQITSLYAIDCLARIGSDNPKVLSALTGFAEGTNSNSYQRSRAIDALGSLGPKAKSAELVLNRNMADSSLEVRIKSAAALWRIRGKTNAQVEWLTQALDEEIHHGSPASGFPDGFGTHEMNLLTLIGHLEEAGSAAQSAVPLIRLVKEEKNTLLQIMVTQALWEMAQETNGLPTTYLPALQHPDPNRRLMAAEYLSDYCVKQSLNLPELKTMLASKDSFVQFFAARALWKINRETATTLPILVESLQDHFTYYRNKDIRRMAAETLGEMGPDAKAAVPALTVALKDPWEEVRVAATNAFKKIDPQAAVRAGVK